MDCIEQIWKLALGDNSPLANAAKSAADELDQLRAQLAEAQAESNFWKRSSQTWASKYETLVDSFQSHPNKPVIEQLEKQLAGSQATNEKLREFVKRVSEQTPEKPDYWSSCSQCEHNSSEAEDLVAQPRDDSALREMVAGVYEECAKVCENSDRYRGDYFAAKIRELAEKAKA